MKTTPLFDTPCITALLLCILVSACDRGTPATKLTVKPPEQVVVTTNSNLDVCEHTTGTCVFASQALRDLATTEALTEVNNLQLTKGGDLVAVIASIRYLDNKDLYAIFFTQTTGLNGTCHACAPHIGVAVYQFHNSWKLFAKNPAVKDIGSWGKISDGSPVFNVLPESTENFLITIMEDYGNQGTQRNMHFIDVGVVDVNPNATISYLDAIVVSTEDCSGHGQGEDWTSDLQIHSQVYPPKVTQVRKYHKQNCSDDKTIAYQKTLNYDFQDGKFQSQTQ
jgi:hypothetical protein